MASSRSSSVSPSSAWNQYSIRPAIASDHAAVLALADRLPAFGPTTRPASEIADRERAALATALSQDRKSTRLNSSHLVISYAVFCLKKKKAGRGAPDSVPT